MTRAPTTEGHALELGRTLREADAAECAALGLEPSRAPLESWRAADFCTTLLLGGRVAAIGGLRLDAGPALGPRTAQAWVLTSALVEQAPHAFHREVKEGLRQAHRYADVLWNQVDARYFVCLRWLLALGFAVGAARPLGPHGRLFHLVTKEA